MGVGISRVRRLLNVQSGHFTGAISAVLIALRIALFPEGGRTRRCRCCWGRAILRKDPFKPKLTICNGYLCLNNPSAEDDLAHAWSSRSTRLSSQASG